MFIPAESLNTFRTCITMALRDWIPQRYARHGCEWFARDGEGIGHGNNTEGFLMRLSALRLLTLSATLLPFTPGRVKRSIYTDVTFSSARHR
ncbi:hypothetical protein [Nitrosospira sp. Nsp1]|uniref:hypothetical protein n=1 Tax=Nitrosospira sp. Nsp1 TaxID=136547 RepID=UPI000888E562|nr:hypothetical protein [Nitrosospira sp. Nsp1]SCX38941.1 hypothetical protein SAMN05720354_102108 [Nitrosospira sp. Nsp1]